MNTAVANINTCHLFLYKKNNNKKKQRQKALKLNVKHGMTTVTCLIRIYIY
jgi:hypothetical protein